MVSIGKVLYSSCLSNYKSLSFISFGSPSLSRIESDAFGQTVLDFAFLPESVVFVAGDEFPRFCKVRTLKVD
jgi:hypothetical protein